MTHSVKTASPSDLSTTPRTSPAPASWSAVVAIGVGAFTLVSAEFLPVGLLPQIAQDLAISEGQAGLMVTAPGIVAACAALLTISVGKHIQRQHALWALLSLLVISNALVACANSLPVLLAARVLLGVAVGGFWTIGVSLGARLRPNAIGRATSIIFSGVTLGTVAGVPAGTLLGGLLGWRLAFAAFAVLVVLVVAALVVLLPRIPPEKSLGFGQVPVVLRMTNVRAGLVAVVLIFTGQLAAYTYIAPFLKQTSGIDSGNLSALLLAYGVAGIIGNIFCGWFVERDVRRAVLVTTLFLGGAMLSLVVWGTNPVWATAAVVAWGVGFGMLPIAIQSWIFKAAPDRLEVVAALFVAVGQLAMGIGALIGGVAVDHFGVQMAIGVGVAGTLGATLWIVARFPR
ncbi:MFS transporter [Pseudomonas mucidolens]|uniref:Predicted arabinose efflux permease, MFS family n=1 Tax=Pseudomonas mucidolens TaxID=46679 RepID=A0A1H2NRV6_9PSED|nr:MFS transporter [Pseudomonas mucidolens]SDV07861.1 Predicted arabinose efflux permease, MFS family [Pseudomonas mucidolens]SQH31265.1 major facilitator family transporter [Pseudomonas mucidolens]